MPTLNSSTQELAVPDFTSQRLDQGRLCLPNVENVINTDGLSTSNIPDATFGFYGNVFVPAMPGRPSAHRTAALLLSRTEDSASTDLSTFLPSVEEFIEHDFSQHQPLLSYATVFRIGFGQLSSHREEWPNSNRWHTDAWRPLMPHPMRTKIIRSCTLVGPGLDYLTTVPRRLGRLAHQDISPQMTASANLGEVLAFSPRLPHATPLAPADSYPARFTVASARVAISAT